MNNQQALQIILSLIEQANAGGFFKTLADLDTVRNAHNTLSVSVRQLEQVKTNDNGNSAAE